MNFRFAFSICLLFAVSMASSNAQQVVDFEDVGAGLGAEDFYNGSDDAGGFTSGPLFFNNTFDQTFGSWQGWSYSNRTDTTTPGFSNQYSSIVGAGDGGSATYAVAFGDTATITSSPGRTIDSFSITNTTFAALSIRDGDQFAKQFGGDTGDDPDFFSVDILGFDDSGNATGSLTFFLADFRFDDNSLDFILDDWVNVDVSSLGASRLGFSFASSDVGQFGINTPTYFAVDNVSVSVPEPSSTVLLLLLLPVLRRRK